MRGRDVFRKFHSIINVLSKIMMIFPETIRLRLFTAVRSWKGKSGIAMRYILLSTFTKHIGDNVVIYEDVYLFNPDKIKFGNNISIHPNSYIQASGGLVIDSDVSIAHDVTIMTETHNYHLLDTNIKDQSMNRRSVCIHQNVWVGAKSTILLGVTIDSGAIIGANSLVNKNVGENEVVGGVPCRLIKKRGV